MNNTRYAIFFTFTFCISFSLFSADLNRSGFTAKSESWADSVLNTMNEKEKIAQLFMLDAYSNWSEEGNKQFKSLLKKYQPGGVIFFKGEKQKQVQLITEWNEACKLPLMIGMDAEWGTGMRLSNALWFPKAMQLGAITDNTIIEELGEALGEQCREAGIHVNFAPVLDVNSNPRNPVINYRSFGEDPQRVSDKAYAFYKGMQKKNVLAVGKHFPGHGDTHVDSHNQLPVIDASSESLSRKELLPFREASRLGIGGLMTGHLSVPSLDKSGMPASLSPIIIDSIIKNEWHYNGLIFSDALNMKAVSGKINDHYLKAFVAGNDVLLFPADFTKAISQIEGGVRQGKITKAVLDARVSKILQYKYMLNIYQQDTPMVCDKTKAMDVVKKAVAASLTVLENRNETLPLKDLDKKNVVLSVGGKNNSEFVRRLKRYGGFDVIQLKDRDGNLSPSVANVLNYDRIIIAIHGSISHMSSNYGLSEEVKEVVAYLPEEKEIIGVLFGNPYALRSVSETFNDKFDAFVVAYDNHSIVQDLSAQLLAGGIPARGTLPVTASERYKVGSGLQTSKSRLGFTSLTLAGLSPQKMLKIDTIVQEAIDLKATPGCQILLVKNGNVIFDKAYGYHTYNKEKAVGWDDVYDLASITKAICTTPVVMQQMEQNQLSLEQGLGEFDGITNNDFKANIRIKELLLHQSGLQPYIPFYLYVFDESKLTEGLFSHRKSSVFSIPYGAGIYANKKVSFKRGWVSKKKSAEYPYQLSPQINLFAGIKDSIFTWIDTSKVDSSKMYRYSDLNYYYLKNIAEHIGREPLDQIADRSFYKPLGMNHTAFNPLKRFPKDAIVPTENDLLFRKGLVHGMVHDQSAAMQNGVGGHAGLFSNALDLGKFSQMLLNGGVYGGKRYYNWKTVDYFTSSGNSENRRSLGFDKPEPDTTKVSPVCAAASLLSYGHTGFTGTMVWIDPVYDLIYVFLSNRVHPDANNRILIDTDVRTRIQQTIYESINKKCE